MAYIFDAAILGILAVSIIECTHKGFVRAVLETGGGIIAGIGTYFLAQPVGKWLAENVFDSLFEQAVSEKLLELMGQSAQEAAFEKIKGIDISALTESAPEALSALLAKFGTNSESVVPLIETEKAQTVVEAIAHPISITVATVLSAFVIFVILMILIMMIAKFTTGLSYLAGVGKINRVFGFLFGVIKGAVVILFISVMINYITPYITEPLSLDKDNPYENTYVYKYIDEYNPLIKILPDEIEG